MSHQQPSRRDELAFWLGMAALLLALCPLAGVVCAYNAADSFISAWAWTLALRAVFLAAPVAGITMGSVSLLIRINWRGGAAIALGACSLLAVVALGMMLADAPDR